MRRLLYIICAIGALCLVGCKQIRYIPIETVRTDSVYINRQSVDTIMLKDSVIIETRNDTVFNTRWRTEYKYKLRTDTLYKEQFDSIVVQVPVEVVKEKAYVPSAMWWIAGVGAVAVIGWLLYLYRRLAGKLLT